MAKLSIMGGRALKGTVRINGAKNACLPIIAASILMDGPTVLTGVPRLTDVDTLCGILRGLGVKAELMGRHQLLLEVARDDLWRAPEDLVAQMRGSVCVLGPLLARRGRAEMPLPGGCVIGQRPIDLHLKGLRALGAEIHAEKGRLRASAERLKGTRIHLGGPNGSTVLGTANVMTAAVLAEGTTVIEHAAREPEVQDLAAYLNACGALVSGAGTSTVTIEGVKRLTGAFHAVIPDRIEAGTFAAAAAITGGDVTLENVRADHMAATLDAMRQMGVRLETGGDSMRVWRDSPLSEADVLALPYPGVPTDMQPQLLALLCVAEGKSVVADSVFPDRFTQVEELCRMGALISRRRPQVVVRGPARLTGARVTAQDLRGGASLILAALAAEGASEVDEMCHVDRGYEQLEDRLNALGAHVVSTGRAPAEAAFFQDRPRRAAL